MNPFPQYWRNKRGGKSSAIVEADPCVRPWWNKLLRLGSVFTKAPFRGLGVGLMADYCVTNAHSPSFATRGSWFSVFNAMGGSSEFGIRDSRFGIRNSEQGTRNLEIGFRFWCEKPKSRKNEITKKDQNPIPTFDFDFLSTFMAILLTNKLNLYLNKNIHGRFN